MPAAAVATIAIAVVLVAVLAYYLVRVVLVLRHVVDTLGQVTAGLQLIARRAEPVDPALTEVNADLTAVAGALEGLLPRAQSERDRTGQT